MIFVDTSAFIAVLDASDRHHRRARAAWERLLDDEIRLGTSNYVVVETVALLQHRIGLDAVRGFLGAALPVVERLWVDPRDHERAEVALLAAGRRKLSLVDCTSFEVMRRLGIVDAFALDRHFREQGFRLV